MTLIINRTDEVATNSYGSKMKIINYSNSHNIIVQFENGYKTKTKYMHFLKGRVTSPYDKRLYGIGYIGEGVYLPTREKTQTKQYQKWERMLRRCYSNSTEYFSYIGCTVCDEWHNFQNFGEWFDKNYYEIPGEKMQLDKDILFKGNKIYSPDTCVFVPQRINNIFEIKKASRGNYPIGVHFSKPNKKYAAQCHSNKSETFLGYYNSPEEAFSVYKTEKENYIKEVADEYKGKIPQRLYKAMYNYVVEITD